MTKMFSATEPVLLSLCWCVTFPERGWRSSFTIYWPHTQLHVNCEPRRIKMARLIISRQHPHPFHHATRIILLSDLLPNTVWFTVHQGGDNFQDVAGTNQTKPPFHTAAVGYSTRTSLFPSEACRISECFQQQTFRDWRLVTAGILFYFFYTCQWSSNTPL